jgi:hypothetical protein
MAKISTIPGSKWCPGELPLALAIIGRYCMHKHSKLRLHGHMHRL